MGKNDHVKDAKYSFEEMVYPLGAYALLWWLRALCSGFHGEVHVLSCSHSWC